MLTEALLLAGGVFLLNVIPAFAPPTWMALSLIGLNQPALNPFAVAVVAAVAATTGRMVLALLSKWIVRDHFMGEETRANIDVLKLALQRHKGATVWGILLFAFSPVPSNYLFMAYGLTRLPLHLIAIPFFMGRCVSYSFWVYAAQTAAHELDIEHLVSGRYLGAFFVMTQIALLGLMWLLAHVDWQYLLQEKRLRLIARKSKALR